MEYVSMSVIAFEPIDAMGTSPSERPIEPAGEHGAMKTALFALL